MGNIGSFNVKFEGECYKLDEKKLPMGYHERSLSLFIFITGFFLFLWYHSKMKNKIFLGLSVVLVLNLIYNFVTMYEEKKRIVQEYGTKVNCGDADKNLVTGY